MKEKTIVRIGWIASVMGILLFAAFFDQIRLNISGKPGSIIMPFVMTLNCIFWTIFGVGRKEMPIIITNAIGVVVTLITGVTATLGTIGFVFL